MIKMLVVLAVYAALRFLWARTKLRWRTKIIVRAIREERRKDYL